MSEVTQTERVPAYEDMLLDMIRCQVLDPVLIIESLLDKFLDGLTKDERDREIQAIAIEEDWAGSWQDSQHEDYINGLEEES